MIFEEEIGELESSGVHCKGGFQKTSSPCSSYMCRNTAMCFSLWFWPVSCFIQRQLVHLVLQNQVGPDPLRHLVWGRTHRKTGSHVQIAEHILILQGGQKDIYLFLSGEEPVCQCWRHKRHGFNPWVGKIPCWGEWLPTLVFLPGESQGQRSLMSYSPWRSRESDTTEAT